MKGEKYVHQICSMTTESAEEEVNAIATTLQSKGKGGKGTLSRRNSWVLFLGTNKGAELIECIRRKGLLKKSITPAISIANRMVNMYARLSDLAHHQISHLMVDIVEGPPTAQECNIVECIGKVWNVETRLHLKKRKGQARADIDWSNVSDT